MAKYEYDPIVTGSNADVRHLLKDGKPRGKGRHDPSATKSKSDDLLNSDDESLDVSAESRIARLSSEGDTQETA